MNNPKPTAIVYIDGLNLYRRLLSGFGSYKWLNLFELSQILLPNYEILFIRYFTARVRVSERSPESAIRQDIYWRALRTLEPKLLFHFGSMIRSQRFYPVHPQVVDSAGNPIRVKVTKTEEKGSDVALGSYMVLDASKSLADLYVLISSDSDLAPPLRILKDELDAPTAIFSPNATFTRALSETKPLMLREIRPKALELAQFPTEMIDSKGKFQRPISWS